MTTIVRDYFSINWARTKRGFFTTWLLFLLVTTAVMFQRQSEYSSLAASWIATAFILAIIFAVVIGGINILDAYLISKRLSREAGLTIPDYSRSEDYRQRGKYLLKRPDGKAKWL